MEKVKVTREQANAIGKIRDKDNAVRMHVVDKWVWDENKCLNSLTLDEFIKALYIGYEVEPEFKENDWIIAFHNNGIWKCTARITSITNNEYLTVDVNNVHGEDLHLSLNGWDTIRHATPEEIKQEKERRKWHEIGREVNEYEIGDIVSTGSITRPIETIWKEEELTLEGMGTDNYYKLDEVFLVCPYENRLDVSANE